MLLLGLPIAKLTTGCQEGKLYSAAVLCFVNPFIPSHCEAGIQIQLASLELSSYS